MPSPHRFASTIRKLEGLPSDNGRTVDTFAGALLRQFVRIGELEADLARVNRRLKALEDGPDAPENGAAASASR